MAWVVSCEPFQRHVAMSRSMLGLDGLRISTWTWLSGAVCWDAGGD